jgi:hypothetical protein
VGRCTCVSRRAHSAAAGLTGYSYKYLSLVRFTSGLLVAVTLVVLMGLAPLAAGLLGKAVYNSGFMGSVKVTGLPILLSALQSAERDKGRGIITVSNHIST